MTSRVVLLYEDKAVGPAKDYGPHKLVVQCVCDALGVEPWRMRDIVEAVPSLAYLVEKLAEVCGPMLSA